MRRGLTALSKSFSANVVYEASYPRTGHRFSGRGPGFIIAKTLAFECMAPFKFWTGSSPNFFVSFPKSEHHQAAAPVYHGSELISTGSTAPQLEAAASRVPDQQVGHLHTCSQGNERNCSSEADARVSNYSAFLPLCCEGSALQEQHCFKCISEMWIVPAKAVF